VFLFFLYVPYEQRYCDAKSESGNFLLRNVVVIVIINVIVNYIYIYVIFSCQLQLLTQEALVIASVYMSEGKSERGRETAKERGRERKSEGENERARQTAKERGRKRIVFTSRASSTVRYEQWRERRDVYIMHYSERSAARRELKRY